MDYDNSIWSDFRPYSGGFAGGGDNDFDLSAIGANTQAAGDQAFAWIGDNPFSGASGELRMVTDAAGAAHLEGDVDGDRTYDFAITIFDYATPHASDFVL